MLVAEANSAICVQNFDDSLNSAIHITYRISLRSSSLREPRYPSAGVVVFRDVWIDLRRPLVQERVRSRPRGMWMHACRNNVCTQHLPIDGERESANERALADPMRPSCRQDRATTRRRTEAPNPTRSIQEEPTPPSPTSRPRACDAAAPPRGLCLL